MCNWGRISVFYTEKRGVHYSGVSNVLKSMEEQSGLSELSILSWVSTVEGCLLRGVPLYCNYMYMYSLIDISIYSTKAYCSLMYVYSLIDISIQY